MIEKKKVYAYRLTESNRQLANFFEDIIIDEENQIIWSAQKLEELGFIPIWQAGSWDEPSLETIFLESPKSFFSLGVMFFLSVFLISVFLMYIFLISCYKLALKIGKLIPNKTLKIWCAKKLENQSRFDILKEAPFPFFMYGS